MFSGCLKMFSNKISQTTYCDLYKPEKQRISLFSLLNTWSIMYYVDSWSYNDTNGDHRYIVNA